MSALVPIIFGVLSKREGNVTSSQVMTSLLNKLVAYQVLLVFLLPIIAGTFINSIVDQSKDGKSLKDVGALVIKVSVATPQQSSFFVVVQMFLNLTLEFLRIAPIIKAAIYSVLAPKLAPREREREPPWFGLSPLSNLGDFAVTDGVSQCNTTRCSSSSSYPLCRPSSSAHSLGSLSQLRHA